jgi:hypothetical protein
VRQLHLSEQSSQFLLNLAFVTDEPPSVKESHKLDHFC